MIALLTSLFAVLGPIFQGLLQALLVQAAKPTQLTVIQASADDKAVTAAAQKQLDDFPGLPMRKAVLLILPFLLLQGCWDRQVVFPEPGVPVTLAEDVTAKVFIKNSDGTTSLYVGILHAGMLVTNNDKFWTLDRASSTFIPAK